MMSSLASRTCDCPVDGEFTLSGKRKRGTHTRQPHVEISDGDFGIHGANALGNPVHLRQQDDRIERTGEFHSTVTEVVMTGPHGRESNGRHKLVKERPGLRHTGQTFHRDTRPNP